MGKKFGQDRAGLKTARRGGKKMARKLKRAFTVVELVIVIAVVAILAAVLIPTFANLIDKAKESSDMQTVKNLNTLLITEETGSGEKPDSMAEVLAIAEAGGYKVENLTPTSDGNYIVWEKGSNRFALIDGEGNAIFADQATKVFTGNTVYKFSNDLNDLTAESDYALCFTEDTAISSADITDLTVSADFSILGNKISSVTIPETFDGTIDLTLNNPAAAVCVAGGADRTSYPTINLYGTAGSVSGPLGSNGIPNAGNFGMQSLHVYGNINNIFVASGKVVAENASNIYSVVVAGSLEADAIQIQIETNSEVSYISTTNGTKLASLDSIVTGNKTNTTIFTESSVSSLFGGGIGTQEAPYLIANESQLKQIGSRVNLDNDYGDTIYYFKLVNDIYLTGKLNIAGKSRVLDLNGHTILLDKAGTIEINSFANVTVTGNGKIETLSTQVDGYIFFVYSNNYKTPQTNQKGTVLTIENGTYIGGLDVVLLGCNNTSSSTFYDYSRVNIKGGHFSALSPAQENGNDTWYVLNCQDDSRATAKFTISGGTFVNLDLYCLTDGNEETNLPTGDDEAFVIDGIVTKTNIGNTADFECTVTKSE